MSTAFTSMAIATGFERRYGVIKRLGASPLPRHGLLLGKVLALLNVVALQLVVLVVVGLLLGWRADARPHRRSRCWAVVLAVALGHLGLRRARPLRRRCAARRGDPRPGQPRLPAADGRRRRRAADLAVRRRVGRHRVAARPPRSATRCAPPSSTRASTAAPCSSSLSGAPSGTAAHRPHLPVGMMDTLLARSHRVPLAARRRQPRRQHRHRGHRWRRPPHRLRPRLPDLAAVHRRVLRRPRRARHPRRHRVRQPDAHLRAGRDRARCCFLAACSARGTVGPRGSRSSSRSASRSRPSSAASRC